METTMRMFGARLMGDPQDLYRTIDKGANDAVARLRVAAFDIPDTGIAFGRMKPQVIDQGSFANWAEELNTRNGRVPFFVDHGDAHIFFGVPTVTKKIGYGDHFTEVRGGLEVDAHYNLRHSAGKDALENLLHDQEGTKFSFRWNADELVYDGGDGYEHVREYPTGVTEFSQVAIPAQADTGLVELVGMRAQEMPENERERFIVALRKVPWLTTALREDAGGGGATDTGDTTPSGSGAGPAAPASEAAVPAAETPPPAPPEPPTPEPVEPPKATNVVIINTDAKVGVDGLAAAVKAALGGEVTVLTNSDTPLETPADGKRLADVPPGEEPPIQGIDQEMSTIYAGIFHKAKQEQELAASANQA
jgi:hypothetical protein